MRLLNLNTNANIIEANDLKDGQICVIHSSNINSSYTRQVAQRVSGLLVFLGEGSGAHWPFPFDDGNFKVSVLPTDTTITI